jgi:hypothetical protein
MIDLKIGVAHFRNLAAVRQVAPHAINKPILSKCLKLAKDQKKNYTRII